MPRPRRKKSKIYFGTPAQEAIIEYNKSNDPAERSKIYEERIKYPFEKLAENVNSKNLQKMLLIHSSLLISMYRKKISKQK